MNKIFDRKNVLLLKIDEDDLQSFLVDTDLQNDGNYDWRLKDLSDSIINVLPEYVYANYTDPSIPMTQSIDYIREAAGAFYKVKEYELMKKYYVDKDTSALAEIKKGNYKNRGEFGELILYMILRDFHGTIPLISKVYFKDSRGVPAHGFDAVHYSPNDKTLWLGETKLYKDAKRGLSELQKDLTEHFNRDYLNEQFIIIKKNVENNSIPDRDFWIQKLTNTHKLSDQVKMINIPLLCVYEDGIYEKFIDMGASQATNVHVLFFARPFWRKLQSIFGEYCISKLAKVAKSQLADFLPAAYLLQTLFNCYSTRYGNGSSELFSSCACSLKYRNASSSL